MRIASRSPVRGPLLSALTALALLAAAGGAEAQEVPSPEDVLGYGIGERFTPPSAVHDYARALAEASPRVDMQRYGTTPEGRPLLLLAVSSEENMGRLVEILERNARLTDPDLPAEEAARIARENPGVVWLSYGVHGDESSSTEAALWTAHDLATGAGELSTALDSLVVVVDPMLNPDGRARYVGWYRSARGAEPNPDPETREHSPPWPSGRTNHYLFDLNRDWAWATQPETRARLAQWYRWNPQVHVDFHEMSPESSYFFFPPTRPHSPIYPDYTFRWSETMGRALARTFDERGWLYYTEEVFDFFYPGYGDTWPALQGAIGMTYEQAGGGSAGLAYRRADGEVLTLTDRATHHRAAGRTTVMTAASRKTEFLMDFAAFHRDEGADYRDVLLVPDGDGREAAELADLLRLQGIQVQRATRPFRAEAEAHPGFDGREEFPVGTLRVPGRQSRARLAATLLRPRVPFDSAGTRFTYDITAWSLPYAYGVEAHTAGSVDGGAFEAASGTGAGSAGEPAGPDPLPELAYGWLLAPSVEDAGALHRYLADGGRARALTEPVRLDGRRWPAGTVFLPGDTAAPRRLAESGLARRVTPVETGLTTEGPELGTEEALTLSAPRVAVLHGDGFSSNSYGFTWFFLEQVAEVPFDALPAGSVDGPALARYDAVILPSGGPGRALDDGAVEALTRWVRDGGTLVAYEGSARWAAGEVADVDVRRDTTEDPPEERLRKGLQSREQRRVERWEERVTGIVLPARLDPDHPLAWGAGAGEGRLFALHRDELIFEPAPGHETVGHFAADATAFSGQVAEPALEHLREGGWLVSAGVGRGLVVLFADDPLYRMFWRSTHPLVTNALFYGTAMTR